MGTSSASPETVRARASARAAPGHRQQTAKTPFASQGATPGSSRRFSRQKKNAGKSRQGLESAEKAPETAS
eukprot:2560257-Alexandrium_andersonii.AAC.1